MIEDTSLEQLIDEAGDYFGDTYEDRAKRKLDFQRRASAEREMASTVALSLIHI